MIQLASRLTLRTASGQIKWAPADRSGEKFIYSLSDASVMISASALNFMGPGPLVTLDIRDQNGIILEALSTEQATQSDTVRDVLSLLAKLPPENKVLQDLYAAVRSQALKSEVVIRRVLDELG